MQYIPLRTAQSRLLNKSNEFSKFRAIKEFKFSSLGFIDVFNPDSVFLTLQFLL